MQILPTSSTSQTSSRSSGMSAKDGLDFTRMISSYMEEPIAQITPTLDLTGLVSSALPLNTSSSDSGSSSNDYARNDDTRNDDPSSGIPLYPTAAPYEQTSTAGSTSGSTSGSATADVRLTGDEVRAVAKSMEEQGASPDVVKRIEELADNPAGVTIEDVVRVAAQEKPAALTDTDMLHIESFLNKLDNSGRLAESVLGDLRAGKASKAWATLSRAMDSLPASTVVTVEKSEMLSLGKALRLNDSSMNMLSKTFGNNDAMKLTPKGLDVMTAPIHHEITTRADAQGKLAGQLEAALTPVLKTARQRTERENNASSRETRAVQQSQTLIQETVTRNTFARQGTENTTAHGAQKADAKSTGPKNQGLAGKPTGLDGQGVTASVAQPGAQSGLQSGPQPGKIGSAEQNPMGQAQAQAQMSSTSKNGQDQASRTSASFGQDMSGRGVVFQNQNAATSSAAFGQSGQQTDQNGNKGQGQDGKNRHDVLGMNENRQGTNAASATSGKSVAGDPWEALISKLSASSQSGSTGMVNSQQVLPGQTGNPQTPRQMAALSARVVSQVEQGMLSAMRDGTKRLELQLNPLDLGAMSVVLSSRNGEVSALLRPERGETAALLSQQVEQLKANLEQQGVKVDKVEVQTQLRDETGTTWQGADQHNSSQEQRARAQEMERNRRLNRVGLGGDVGDDLLSARDLRGMSLNRMGTEQGLHLVA